MAINKKFICFKTLENYQREYDAGNILPKSICFCADAKAIYLNGKQFSINSLYNLELLLESGTELASTDHLDEAVVKLYNNIKLIQEDIENVENEHTELAKIVKLLASEIADLETGLKEEIATNAEITSAALNDLNTKWDDLANMFKGLEELLAYGVEWNVNVADPHLTRIGNMSLHKTLPIQSLLKGCIALKGKIMYWLGENDWRFRKDPIYMDVDLSNDVEHPNFGEASITDLGVGQYVKAGSHIGKIAYIEGASVTVEWEENLADISAELTTITKLEIGSRLDGYDGTVRVYCPNFYIKSQIIGDIRRVWLSTIKIDDTWTYQPEILIDAYRSTVLQSVPENMGYLSTLPVNSAISVVNTATYCRGNRNDSSYDKYLEGVEASEGIEEVPKDVLRTHLGKPRTVLRRKVFREYARNAGSELLSYNQYKNIFYWLYIVEYANFDCLEEYNEALTSEGYRQGGLGLGVTDFTMTSEYNGASPMTPCGYGNKLGNRTGLIPITRPKFTYNNKVINAEYAQVPRWRGFDNVFGDCYIFLDGIIVKKIENSLEYYASDDPSEYTEEIGNKTLVGTGMNSLLFNVIKYFDLGETAEIVPITSDDSLNTYKCDSFIAHTDTSINELFIGGNMTTNYFRGRLKGLTHLNLWGLNNTSPNVGCITVNKIL